jgi:predicted permease
MKTARLIVRLAAWLAPPSMRDRWREEWLGELGAGRPRPLRRALGAPRDAWTLRWTLRTRRPAHGFGLWPDARDAWRSLRRTPLQALTMVVCLTLGATLTVLTFGVVNAMLGGDMPGVRDQRRLVRLAVERAREGRVTSATMGQFRTMPSRIPGLGAIAAEVPWRFSTSVAGQAVATSGLFVSGAYFSTLGTVPALGRLIAPPDDRPEAAPIVVIGHAFWRRHFHESPAAIGSTITIGTGTYRIVGVAPRRFVGLDSGDFGETADERADIWIPMAQMWVYPDFLAARVDAAVGPRMVGRLDALLSRQHAESLAQAALGRASSDSPWQPIAAIRLRPFHLLPTSRPGQTAALISTLMSLPLIVLAIACANVAGVQLARAVGRTREVAIRMSLGATRWRAARLLFVETALISAGAGVTAWVLASRVLEFAGDVLPFAVAADIRVLIFAVGLPMAITLLAGLLPAWRATGIDVQAGLRLGSRVGRVASPVFRRSVVITQLALSSVLVVSAAVVGRSVVTLPDTIGPAQPDVMAARIRFGDLGLETHQENVFREHIVASLTGRRDVDGVAWAKAGLFGSDATCWTAVEKPEVSGWDVSPAKSVSPTYFSVLGLAARQGRTFAVADGRGAVVVNEELATRFFGGNPVGSPIRIRVGAAGSEVAHVVGVVANSYERAPRGSPRPLCYLAIDPAAPPPARIGDFAVFAKSARASALVADLQRTLSALDTRLSATEIGTIAAIMSARYRWLSWTGQGLTWVTLIAIVVSGIGLFGAVSYGASLRTHEFGVRLALGARPADVVRSVTRESVLMTLAGTGVGLALSVPVAMFLGTILFVNIDWRDPVPPIIVIGVLATIGALASMLPASRVTRITPVAALRAE